MIKIDTSIFRKYDIRGLVAGDSPQITPELARLVGKALGTYLPEKSNTEQMFVGCDKHLLGVGFFWQIGADVCRL